MSDKQPILVWRFDDAPEELRAMSRNGGDEDWLAELPPEHAADWIGWLEEGGSFGCCNVDAYPHPTKPGWGIKIGCHA